jgi:hypothetical protein
LPDFSSTNVTAVTLLKTTAAITILLIFVESLRRNFTAAAVQVFGVLAEVACRSYFASNFDM